MGIVTTCVISAAILTVHIEANPCDDKQANSDIQEKYPIYTDSSNTKHCFFRLTEEVVNTTYRYYEEPEPDSTGGIHARRYLNKTKCQEACGKYQATLPILSYKDIFEFLQEIADKRLVNGWLLMGVKIMNVIDDDNFELEWDTKVKTQVNKRGVYGTNKKWNYYDDKEHLILLTALGDWESAEFVGFAHHFYLVCHFNPDFVVSTSTTMSPVESTSESARPSSSSPSVQTFSITLITTESLQSTTDFYFDTISTIATVPETTTPKDASTTSFASAASSPHSATKLTENTHSDPIASTIPTTQLDSTTSAFKPARNLTTTKLPTTNILDSKFNPAPSSAQASGKLFWKVSRNVFSWKPIFYIALFYALYVCHSLQ